MHVAVNFKYLLFYRKSTVSKYGRANERRASENEK